MIINIPKKKRFGDEKNPFLMFTLSGTRSQLLKCLKIEKFESDDLTKNLVQENLAFCLFEISQIRNLKIICIDLFCNFKSLFYQLKKPLPVKCYS